MSIWCSSDLIGHDDYADDPPNGDVRSYATGYSNHYPDHDIEQPASIDTAYLPPYCVPGHRDDWFEGSVGPWLRLGVSSWKHNYYKPEEVLGEASADVVLDVAAVQALADYLNQWLAMEKVYPLPEVAP